MLRLLADRPEYRPATAGVVVQQLAEMLAGMEKSETPLVPVPEPEKPRRSFVAVAGIAAGAAVLGGGAVLAFTTWTNGQSTAAPLPSSPVPVTSSAPSVPFVLAEPSDQTSFVDLTWTAPPGMTFAVAVAAENEQTKVLIANQNRTMRVPVEPQRKYCFQIQATDGVQVLQSTPKPIRGAVCRG